MIPLCGAGRTPNRGCEPPQFCQPHTIALVKAPTNRPAPPPPFSSIMVRLRRWLAPKLGLPRQDVNEGMRAGGERLEDVPASLAGGCDDRTDGGEVAGGPEGAEGEAPEIFILTFIIRRACSARLLVKGTEKS